MNKGSSAKAQSLLKRLSNYALKIKVPFDYVLTSFLIERLAVRLVSNTNLASALVFKGGYVGLRVYNSPRYTIDLDVLLCSQKLNDAIELAKTVVLENVDDEVWFAFKAR